MSAQSLVYILLLNYRGASHTLACLDSLRQLAYLNFRIIVIDNASPDDSLTQLQDRLHAHPGEFQLIESKENLGYSGGNNLGIQAAMKANPPETDAYIWLLNNDTTVDKNALAQLVKEAQRTGGLAGSLLLYPDGRYQQVGTHINWWTGGTQGYPESAVRDGMPVETLSGASMLISFRVLRQVGLLDESFFLYFEDGEASLRYIKAGFPLTVATQSLVYHMEGATTGSKSLATQYYFHRNRLRLLMRFANPLQKITIRAYALFRLWRARLKCQVSSKSVPESKHMERRRSAQVQALAVQDFFRGVSGPCPHQLEDLK
jgi:GT2 family glycosyltransferase